jgi:lipopolysaccharide export system protein LptA
VPDTGLARIVGHVHITRGDNQLNGAAAIVNMKTGVATIVQTPGVRVQGLIVPNEQQPKGTDAGAGKSDKPAPTNASAAKPGPSAEPAPESPATESEDK